MRPHHNLPTGGKPSVPLSRRTFALAAVTAAALTVGGCSKTHPQADKRDGMPLALVYAGPQGCDDCAPTIASVLRSGPRPYRVQYVGPGTGTTVDEDALRTAALYVQPGGGSDLNATMRDLEPSADAIRSFVHEGGSFLGLCFGAYLAGHDPGLGLLPGDTYGWAGSPGASVPDDRDTVIPVAWRGHTRHVYFQDGPAFTLRKGADAKVIATYPNGVPAALVARFGTGKVAVSGAHPEATRAWFKAAGLTNPDGYRSDLAHDLINAARPDASN